MMKRETIAIADIYVPIKIRHGAHPRKKNPTPHRNDLIGHIAG
jgi:hypothetical protein